MHSDAAPRVIPSRRSAELADQLAMHPGRKTGKATPAASVVGTGAEGDFPLRPRLQSGSGRQASAIVIGLDGLGLVLEREAAPAQRSATTAASSRQQEIDRRAVDRAENEGLALRSALAGSSSG